MKNRKVLFVLAAGALVAPLLAFTGATALKAEDGTITYLERTFTTDGIADAKTAVNMNVLEKGGEFAGIFPADRGAVSYLTYEIKTRDTSNSFESMTFALDTGRFAYYAGDFGNNFDVYLNDTSDALGDKVYTVAGTSTAQTSFNINLDEKVAVLNTSTVYLSFGFSPKNAGCGYDATWTMFDHVKITGTEKGADATDIISHKVSDNWRNGTSQPNSNTYNANRINNLGGDGNATHGAIVGTWGGTLSVEANESGWVEYKLGSEDEILQSASFKFVAKFNNMGNGDIHTGDRLFVKASSTGEDVDFENHVIAKYRHGDEEGWIDAGNSDEYTQTVDLTSFIESLGKTKYIYVRFQMMHYLALSNIELDAWGTKMFETSASYTAKKGYFINYDLDGGTLPDGSQSAFYESDGVYTLPTPTKDDYDFKGWKDGEGNIVTTFDPSGKTNLSVEATWEIKNSAHSITYVGADGLANPNPVSYKDNDGTITLIDLNKEGYDFLGFYDAETGGNKVTSIDPDSKPGDLTLYARWVEKEFDVAYDLAEGVSLTASGLSALPSKVKYTETLTLKASVAEGKGIAKLTVDGVAVDPSQDIVVKGSDLKAHSIQATVYSKYNVVTKVDENYGSLGSYDYSFGAKAYDSNNIAIKHDSDANAGLCKAKEGEDAFITYKFAASEGKEITKIKVSGLARIFDVDGAKSPKFIAYTSSDNSSWKALKEYSPTKVDDGNEAVSLDFTKALSSAMETLYIKIAWDCTSGGNDWVVLKKLGIEITESAKEVPPTSSEETSSSETPAPSTSETPVTPDSGSASESKGGDSSGTKNGCGGEIVGTAVVALGALAGVTVLVLKRKKDDK